MTHVEKINLLLNQVEEKLQHSKVDNSLASNLRENNLKHIALLYKELELEKKHPDFSTIFNYKAMNLAGIGLKNEDFGEIREGKYVQIIAISYEINNSAKRIVKNSSLGYYGKAEKLTKEAKSNIIEFVLRWRYEKTFQHSEYYQQLLSKLH